MGASGQVLTVEALSASLWITKSAIGIARASSLFTFTHFTFFKSFQSDSVGVCCYKEQTEDFFEHLFYFLICTFCISLISTDFACDQ